MKNPFKQEQIIRKQTFSYEKSGISLSFTLNLGNKGEMINFKEPLEKALIDVTDEIKPKNVLVVTGGSKEGTDPDNGGGGASCADRLIERETP